ncbi:MAG: hypothetical protein J7539_10505, partial [Niabella sp.]|nr:hypothetical protein [Niabella sp.]
MKRISVCSLLFIVSAAITIFSSCKRDMPHVASVNNNTDTTALVQVFNGIANSARNKIYVDGNQISGSVVSEGGVFPATAIAFSVSPGTRAITIKDTLATSAQQPLVFSQNFEKGKKYSVFTYDTITSPK